MYEERLKKIIENMKKHGISQMVVTSTPNIYYLTGVWIDPGERLYALYINEDGSTKFILNELFISSPGIENLNVTTYSDNDDPIDILSKLVDDKKSLGVDKNWPAHFLIALMERKSSMKFEDASLVLDETRMVKDDAEIKELKKSSEINDSVMKELPSLIEAGKTEKQFSKEISALFEKNGVEKQSFETIVSYGKNAADPHHFPDETVLKSGDCIVIDMGGVYNHYCSDMTRTYFFGRPCSEAEKIYETVLLANEKAESIIKPGVKLCDIDKAGRDIISDAGWGKYFTHRIGHNIGIEDHEYPSVSLAESLTAKPGMVFSIEPGIYIPQKYGVRIEDLVLVTETGVEVLNHYTKKLQIK